MKKLKFVIIFLGFIIIVLIVMLLGNRNFMKNKDEIVDLSNIEVPYSLNNIGYQEYFTVSSCISQYLDILNKRNDIYYGIDKEGKYTFTATSDEVSKGILSLISDNYKSEQNINDSNVLNKIKMLDEKNIPVLTKVYKLVEGNVYSYVATGFLININDEYLRDVNFIVNMDILNKTFSIQELSKNADLNNLNIDKLEKIEKNDYNKYIDYSVNTEDVISKHVLAYKRIMLAKPELAYEYLDKDYRDKRFGSYENFQKYIKENESEITSLNMKKYKVSNLDDAREYIIIDDNGNYYRFFEKEVMDYTVMLDVYTIELPQFIEQYNSVGDEQKVSLNVEKFIQMINAKDYKAAYSLLDNTFKANNFPTLDDFVKYIQDNFHNYNTIDSIENITKEGKYYTCTAYLKNTKFMNNEPIERSFVIALGDGTDFKMSINLDY